MILTVCIPTFNRADEVIQTVAKLTQTQGFGEFFDVLVSDNASDDGTSVRLKELYGEHPAIRLHRQSKNLGFALNFLWLVDHARAKYALLLSDEDEVLPENLEAYALELAKTSQSFCSPVAEMHFDGWPGRGLPSSSPVTPGLISQATFYISGLTYNTEEAQQHIPRLRELALVNEYVRWYPQSALLALVLQESPLPCSFVPTRVTRQRVVIEQDLPYVSPESRKLQYLGAIAFANELLDGEKGVRVRFLKSENRIYQSIMFDLGFRNARSFLARAAVTFSTVTLRRKFYFGRRGIRERFRLFSTKGF